MRRNDLTGKTILIASGPTFAPLDAVRSITNHSSGRLGSEIAYRMHQAGADIIFLAGKTSVTPKDLFADNTLEPIPVLSFRTVNELKQLLQRHVTDQRIDLVVMAAAVLDYLPESIPNEKHSSKEDTWVITLKRGEKLIEQIRSWNPSTAIVGFKLESGIPEAQLKDKAVDLMNRSGAVLVVGNLKEHIQGNEHHARIYARYDANAEVNMSETYKTKREIADGLTRHVIEYFRI